MSKIIDDDSQFGWKVGDPIGVYASRERGKVIQRTIEVRDGEDEARYLVRLNDGAQVWYWEQQLERVD